MYMSNELPKWDDVSTALPSRFVLLVMKNSFFGQEDTQLTNKLLKELPGILNWSIEGWKKLHDREEFLQPQTGEAMLRELTHLASPIKDFVEDCCKIEEDQTVKTTVLYTAWTTWCYTNGYKTPTVSRTFGRDLRAAYPKLQNIQKRIGASRERWYKGIGLS